MSHQVHGFLESGRGTKLRRYGIQRREHFLVAVFFVLEPASILFGGRLRHGFFRQSSTGRYANGMNPRLEFPPEEMRRMGYRVVDMIVEHLSTLGEQPVGAKGDPKELLASVGGAPPEEGASFDHLLADLRQRVLHNTMHVNHPRFFAYVPGPSNYVGALADAIISGYNVFAGTWISGSGAAAVELETIHWLRPICGLPPPPGR